MTGFLKPHGTSAALYGSFIAGNSNEDDTGVRKPQFIEEALFPFIDRIVAHDAEAEYVNSGQDEAWLLEDFIDSIELDITGRADLILNSHEWHDGVDPYDIDFSRYNGDDWYDYCRNIIDAQVEDSASSGIAVYTNTEGKAIMFHHEDYPTEFERCELNDDGADDSFSPSFYGRNRMNVEQIASIRECFHRRTHTLPDERGKYRKWARYRIDGERLARKCLRDRRFGNRQEFELDRDYWADRYEAWEAVMTDYERPAVPTFDPSLVGMTDEEASFYETEMRREEERYEAELERSLWGHYEEPDYSVFFRPQTALDELREAHERYLFPENFEEPEPYRFSMFDYDDSYFGGMDCHNHESYYGQYYESDPWRDEDEWRFFSEEEDDLYMVNGKPLTFQQDDFDAEWEEIDRRAREREEEAAADAFMPSHSSSNRVTLRDRLSESRRGKAARRHPAGRVVRERYQAALQ